MRLAERRVEVTFEGALVLLAISGFIAFVARGITGAASAIVFNALFGLALALGLAGDLTLLDGLYWIALSDLVAGIVMVVVLRHELRAERFVIRLLAVLVPLSVVFALLLPALGTDLLAAGLGATLVLSGLYLGLRPHLATWDEARLRRWALPTGLAGGVLNGLYGMAGPVVLVYLAHAGTETRRFRARSTVIATTMSTIRGVVLIASGAIGAETVLRFGITAPVVVLGLGVGMWLHPRIGPRALRLGLGILVIVAGVMLVARSFIDA